MQFTRRQLPPTHTHTLSRGSVHCANLSSRLSHRKTPLPLRQAVRPHYVKQRLMLWPCMQPQSWVLLCTQQPSMASRARQIMRQHPHAARPTNCTSTRSKTTRQAGCMASHHITNLGIACHTHAVEHRGSLIESCSHSARQLSNILAKCSYSSPRPHHIHSPATSTLGEWPEACACACGAVALPGARLALPP